MASFTAPKDSMFDSVAPATGVRIFQDSSVLSLLVAFEDSPDSANLKLRGSFDANGDIVRLDSGTWTAAGAQTSISFADATLSATLAWTAGSIRVDDLWKTLLSGDDWVTLGDRGDRIDLGAGDDFVRAGDGDDTLWGGAGADVLRGDDGVDTAAWNFAAANYTLALEPGAIRVADRTGGDGVDTLFDVERLHFADKSVIVETGKPVCSYEGLPVGLYHFFNVAFAAAPGVTYMDQLAEAWNWFYPLEGGSALQHIVEIFTGKEQFTSVYPLSLSNEALATELVNRVIKNSASDAAKAESVQYIYDALELPPELGWTRGKVIYTVFDNLAAKSEDDPTWGNTARQFANEIAVAKYYTEVLHQSTTDVDTLRDVIAPVTQDTDVSTTDAIVTLIGQALMEG